MTSRELGEQGEYFARLYLEKKGFDFIRANYATRHGEIDLIMQENDEIVFIEVKTRSVESAKAYGRGAERIDRKKRERILRSARVFLYEETRLTRNLTPRFDAVELYVKKNEPQKLYVIHTPCAFGL